MESVNGAYQRTAPPHDSSGGTGWHSPKSLIALQPAEVQVWRVDGGTGWGTELLAAEEVLRAQRFRHEKAREHFVAGRSALRVLLGYQLGLSPVEVRLTAGAQGKPMLQEASRVGFNVAHSGGVILIALALEAEVGVDVEQITPGPDPMEIAEKMFAAGERAALSGMAEEEQRVAFFRIWSRKEAVIKADGRGLSLGTATFEAMGERVAVPPRVFSLRDLPMEPGYAAALATTALEAAVRLLRFTPVSLPLV